MHKACSICGGNGPFYRDNSKKDGMTTDCQECRKKKRSVYYENNKESVIEKSKDWYRNNIDRAKATSSENTKKHLARHNSYKHKKRAIISGNSGSYTEQEWIDLCSRYDNRCLCCGEKKPLTVDHIIPIGLEGGTSNIDNLQPLCALCNNKKKRKIIDYRY